MNPMQERTVRLVGEAKFERLQQSLVTVVGIGGVGGHCIEALARAGVGRLHMVDYDTVAPSNLNRQLVATKATIGMKKTEAMLRRVRAVSDCAATVADVFVSDDTVQDAVPQGTDFIVDAVDSLAGKVALAAYANEHGIPIVSCMGAGNRLDPTGFTVMDLFDTKDCPLARRMRQALRRLGIRTLPVVCSVETPAVKATDGVIGSLAPVTAAAGLCLAGYVLNRLMEHADSTM